MRCHEKIIISRSRVVFYILVLMLVPSVLLAQYVITRSVFDAAGEKRESSSFELVDVVGQTAAQVLESSSYTLRGGFLYNFAPPDDIGDGQVGGNLLPRTFALGQNYPNPFNPSTTIRFDIPGSTGQKIDVRLDIYNIRGQHIRTLLDSESVPGTYTVHWDGRNSRGERVGSGIYLYRVVAGEFTAIRKMVMVK
jgi:hypothetical protein